MAALMPAAEKVIVLFMGRDLQFLLLRCPLGGGNVQSRSGGHQSKLDGFQNFGICGSYGVVGPRPKKYPAGDGGVGLGKEVG